MRFKTSLFAAAPCIAAGVAACMPWGVRVIDYPENEAFRIASFAQDAAWTLSGEDAGRFLIQEGVLRFSDDGVRVALPNFELPRDADGDNVYRVAVHADVGSGMQELAVRVTDRDEPGVVVLSAHSPVMGETVRSTLADPDGVEGEPVWRWERWNGRDWAEIPDAVGGSYTPQAADAGQYLRATAVYADRHGAAARARAFAPNPVLGPRLTGLEARVESDREAALKPAFDPFVRHYGIACAERDILTLGFTAPPDARGARVSVNGVQPPPGRTGGAAVPVTPVSDAVVTLSTPDGAATDYTVHCMPPALAALRTVRSPEASPLGELLALANGAWVAVIDQNAVPRAHRTVEGETATAAFFLRPFSLPPPSGEFGPDTPEDARDPTAAEIRWAYGFEAEEGDPGRYAWVVLDRDFSPLRTVTTAAPLQVSGRHDFRILDDSAALMMAYEPAVRDLTGLDFPHAEGKPWSSRAEVWDSAIQAVGPDGGALWTWNSWGRLPLEDCVLNSIPMDYAHVNSLQWVGVDGASGSRKGVLASFRNCSTVLMIDPHADEVVWRLGETNLDPADWAGRGLGPAPMRIVGDPEGAFCGQHAAQLLPNGRLLLYDNGTRCVTRTGTDEPLTRPGGVFSRAVEYALDHAHGEAVFVRDHALGGGRDRSFRSGGHVAMLGNGDWLVSWGTGSNGTVTRFNPVTGVETFVFDRTGISGGFRALPVSPLALAPEPEPLTAEFPDLAPAGHSGSGGQIEIALAFSRPVAEFGAGTRSIEVDGGELVAVAPEVAFGRPANSYLLTLAPDGEGPLTLRLLGGIACETGAAGGICAADGTVLTDAPKPVAVPFRESIGASVDAGTN